MGNLQITLKAARVNAGYTIEEISKITGKAKDTIMKYERDSSAIPRNYMFHLLLLYGVTHDHIFFGNESDFIRLKKEAIVNYV